jgi:RNA polymerase sigma factor (sigma-70 family)
MTQSHTTPTTNFEEFYLAWEPKVKTAVYQAGFYGVYAEELFQDIFLELLKGDYLSKYESDKGTFANFIWGHVRVRILGRKRELGKQTQYEFVSDPIEDDEKSAIDDSGMEMAELKSSLSSIYLDLKTLPATESKNLARLFKEIVSAIQSNGYFSQVELASKMGVSRQAISSQIRDLAKTRAMRQLYDSLKDS